MNKESIKQDPFFKNLEEQMKSPEGLEEIKESEEDRIMRGLEEQMKSPEGLEGIEIPKESQKVEKKERDPKMIEKRQKFWKEFWKWEDHYSLGSSGLENDEIPKYLNPEVKFEDQNNFNVPLGFLDYLIENSFEGAPKTFSEKLKNSLNNLEEIIFVDILTSGEQLQLELKSIGRHIYLSFEPKYPFKYKGSGVIFD